MTTIDAYYLEDVLAAGGGKRHVIAISPFPKFIMAKWTEDPDHF